MPADSGQKPWILGAPAARILGCPPHQVPKLAAKGFLTVRRLPGCDPLYLRSDVEHLASQTTQPASIAPTGCPENERQGVQDETQAIGDGGTV